MIKQTSVVDFLKKECLFHLKLQNQLQKLVKYIIILKFKLNQYILNNRNMELKLL